MGWWFSDFTEILSMITVTKKNLFFFHASPSSPHMVTLRLWQFFSSDRNERKSSLTVGSSGQQALTYLAMKWMLVKIFSEEFSELNSKLLVHRGFSSAVIQSWDPKVSHKQKKYWSCQRLIPNTLEGSIRSSELNVYIILYWITAPQVYDGFSFLMQGLVYFTNF